jgi:uncharacterized protein (DUF1800 family)
MAGWCSRIAARAAVSILVIVIASGAAAAAPAVDRQRLEFHILNRLAFGPNAADVAAIERLGADRWIERQLAPDSIAESPALEARLDGLQTTALDPVDLFEQYGPPIHDGAPIDRDAVKAARQRARIIVREAAEARVMRAIWSRRQLQEVLVDFWYNHFNVFAGKGLDHLWVGSYEATAIRPYVLGHFGDLLEATARHPAMLFYLDNWQNAAPGSPAPHGRESGINENYAREIMELHTLGVDGGYTQADVTALAHVLTGWGIARPRNATDGTGFAFYPRRHDDGDKILLGRVIRGSGESEVEQALQILAESPATAHHLSFLLAQYFVADQPPPALVDRMTARWIATDGDLRAVLKVLFFSREFRAPKAYGAKFKTPYEYVVSAVRASGVGVSNFRPLLGAMVRLGEPLYGCQTPDGYKNTRDVWLNPDAMTLRVSFATALGAGRLPLDRAPVDPDADPPAPQAPGSGIPLDAATLQDLLQPILSAKTRAAVAQAPPPLKAALILGGPEFMMR